jgi:hypothetical protein
MSTAPMVLREPRRPPPRSPVIVGTDIVLYPLACCGVPVKGRP